MVHLDLKVSPKDCKSKDEIRDNIDKIDKAIIELFAKRFEYVSEIVKFKSDTASIVAEERKNHVIENRGKWAEELGLDKDTFEDIFKILIHSNIKKELVILDQLKKKD